MRKQNNLDIGLLLLRIAVGGLMILHGIHKLMAPMQTIESMSAAMESVGLPAFLAYGVFIGELIAPLLILIGWRTKLFAPFVAITMIMAIVVAHPDQILTLTDKGGLAIELQALYLLGALALSFTGAGRFAVSSKNQWD